MSAPPSGAYGGTGTPRQGAETDAKRGGQTFGVTQPRVSDLTRGKIDLFSIDTLMGMLARAGMRVELRLARVSRGRGAQAA